MRLIPCFLILAVSIMTGGCVTPISSLVFDEEGVAPLSKSGCPDLTGHYLNLLNRKEDRFHEWFYFGGILARQDYVTKTDVGQIILSRSPEDSQVKIYHGTNKLVITLKDKSGYEKQRLTINLDTPDTGCRDGALVLRWRQYSAGAEMTPSNQHYGEIILKKEEDGSILYSTWSRSRQYPNLLRIPSPGMGKPMQTWRVKPVPQWQKYPLQIGQ